MAMVTAGGDIYCYHFDASANAIALTDSGESVVNAYAYTPFGQIANESETVEQPFRFAAQFGVITEPNGLYYMKARYYDSEVGRFISEDPLGFDGGDLNLYQYAHANPIMFMDPLGLCPNRYFYQAGNATGKTEINAELGQAVWITVKNVNVLGTTVRISEQAGALSQRSISTQEGILLPLTQQEFKFTTFGVEPMNRNFTIDSVSDAFIINYTIESTWVPGMPPNR
jgi:RHS repeat-associated protein